VSVTFCKCQYWCSRVRSIPSMARPSTRSITDSQQPFPAPRHAGSSSADRTIAVAAGRGPFSQRPKGPTNHGSSVCVRNRSLSARLTAASWQKCAAAPLRLTYSALPWMESPPERGESAVAGSITPAVVPGKYDIVTTPLRESGRRSQTRR
jgi:hypothetical protein